MPRKVTSNEVDYQQVRADNYAYHYQCRQYALALGAKKMTLVANAVETLPRPQLNVYGNFCDFSVDEWRQVYRVAGGLGMEAAALLWWYWSDAGWQDFQSQWAELPEVVHMPCVQPAQLSTLYTGKREAVKLYTKSR